MANTPRTEPAAAVFDELQWHINTARREMGEARWQQLQKEWADPDCKPFAREVRK